MRLVTIAIAVLVATTAHAQQTWVAVATDGRSNFGTAAGMATREAAEITALGECGGGCTVRMTAPARCVAYAYSDTGIAAGYGAGATRETVEQTAWADCNRHVPANSCTVRATRCFE